MLLIWRGKGILVPIILFVASLISEIIGRHFFGKPYVEQNRWILGLAMLLGSAFILFVARKIDTKERILIDEKTGERLIYKPKHDFFWIPIKWWSPVAAGIGVVLIINSLRMLS